MEGMQVAEIIKRHVNPENPELKQKLVQSKEAVQGIPLRAVRCPLCGYYLLDVYGKDHCYIRVKCRKCKFDDVIDTALFRTWMRKHRDRMKTGSIPGAKSIR